MKTLTMQEFKENIFDSDKNDHWKYEGKPFIIDFYADWCNPCKMLTPILEEISKDQNDKITIYKVNTETEPDLAALFGIRSIPTLVFAPSNEDFTPVSGFRKKTELEELIKKILKV